MGVEPSIFAFLDKHLTTQDSWHQLSVFSLILVGMCSNIIQKTVVSVQSGSVVSWERESVNSCCVSIQGLHPSEEHLKANYVTMLREGCPSSKAPPNAAHRCGLLFPLFGGCTATILCGLTYPKILCMPERKTENDDSVWCRSSLLRA